MNIINYQRLPNRNKKIKAFTLLETLVSISIIAAVVIGPLTVAVNSASYARQSKDTMTATYLAEESLELLHHEYDSIYLTCINNEEPCLSFSDVSGETLSEKAWRFFKWRIAGSGGAVSCFKYVGCTYDFLNMTDISVNPEIYDTSSTECSKYFLRSALMLNDINIIRKFYVCSGVFSHQIGTFVLNPYYSRSIVIESIPTFETIPVAVPETPNLGLYSDDLRVVTSISFKRTNGMTKQIKVTDFLHARL